MPDTRAPWHHWPIAILTLLFYGIGALDYTFTQFRLGFYLSNFTDEQVTFIRMLPAWLEYVWAFAVWGGLLGAWLLWRRNRLSVLLLFAASVAIGLMTVWLCLFLNPSLIAVSGLLGLYVMAGSTAISLLLYIYARWERSEKKL